MGKPRTDDPYRRLNYRRLIAWPARIEREWPFLERTLAEAPDKSVLDLGSGTGEHVRFLASQGFHAVGVDRSEEQIGQARDYEDEYPPFGPRFLHGDFRELARLTDRRFGAALCLGNVLPHVEDEALAETLAAVAARLLPGGRLVVQILNYERILAEGVRYLPVNFREDPEGEGEIVFLRLVTPAGPGHVLFHPMTLAFTPGAEPPVALKAVKEVRLRAWTWPELRPLVEGAGFEPSAVLGDVEGSPYRARESFDLVLVAALRDRPPSR